jgi:FkbM family methyltransferase
MLKRWPATIKDIRPVRPDYGKLVEVLVSAVYHRFVETGDKVIDGGTNAGMHLFPLAQLVGTEGRVFGFEPNPQLVARIRQRIERDKIPQIEMFECAISDEAGPCEFVIYADNSALSHIAHTGPRHTGTEGVETTVTVARARIDDLVEGPISFIKMDLEGGDFRALQGATRVLEGSRPLVIFENGRSQAASRYNYSPEDFFSFFQRMRYALFDVHAVPFSRDKWDSGAIGWEAFAVPVEAPYTAVLLTFLQRYWASVIDWPLVPKWSDCAALGRALPNLRQI